MKVESMLRLKKACCKTWTSLP